jgi:hypothetical protein
MFRCPGISSTLGGLNGGVAYAAYHNFVNFNVGEVRYAVVPFHEDYEHQAAAAARAFVEAAFNPNGAGWF